MKRDDLQKILYDLDEMIYHDRADDALRGAIRLKESEGELLEDINYIISTSARVILCSGSYSPESRILAAKHNSDSDLKNVREKIMKEKK